MYQIYVMTFKPFGVLKSNLKRGVVATDKFWEQPTQVKFEEWTTLVKQYIKTQNIQVNMYVCGKFIEKPEITWDVDVILSHPTEMDFVQIRDLMNYGMQLSLDKFNMLVNMAFYIPFNKEGKFWYSPEEYMKYGKIETKALYTFNKIEYNDEIIQEFKSSEQIIESLFVVKQISPSDKHIKRIKNGEMYMKPINI